MYRIVKSFGVITKRYTSIRQNRKPLYFVYVTNSDAIKLIRLVRPRNGKRIRKWAQQDLNSQINGHDHQLPAFQGPKPRVMADSEAALHNH